MSVTGRVGVNTLELDKGYESFFWGGGARIGSAVLATTKIDCRESRLISFFAAF